MANVATVSFRPLPSAGEETGCDDCSVPRDKSTRPATMRSRTTSHNAPSISAVPGQSFIVMPSVPTAIAAVRPMAIAAVVAPTRRRTLGPANSAHAIFASSQALIPAGSASANEIARGSQSAATIA